MYRPFFDHGGPGWVGGLFGLLIVVAIVAGVVLLTRAVLERPRVHPGPPAPPPLTRAVEELDLRYARGEIDRAEYLQRRADLMHGGHLAPPPLPPSPPAASAP